MNITVRTQTDISFFLFLAVFFSFYFDYFFLKDLAVKSNLRKFPLAPILTTDHVQDVRGVCVFGAGGGTARRRETRVGGARKRS